MTYLTLSYRHVIGFLLQMVVLSAENQWRPYVRHVDKKIKGNSICATENSRKEGKLRCQL